VLMIIRIVISLIVIWMTIASLLPFFGINFVLFRGATVEPILLNEENTYLHVVRSAAFATMALFGLNYLRNKRPLFAVAPLLVFASFLCIYAPLYLFIRGTSYWWEWASFTFMVGLAVILFRENKAEAKKIFLNDW
jgi:hypothetical protein